MGHFYRQAALVLLGTSTLGAGYVFLPKEPASSPQPSPGSPKRITPKWETAWGVDWDWNWDTLHETFTSKSTKTHHHPHHPQRQIILVRHGEYQMDVSGNPLTKLGFSQAAVTGKRLKALLKPGGPLVDTKISHFYCSDQTRAMQTATTIAKQLGIAKETIKIDPNLHEGIPCEPIPTISKVAKMSEDSRRKHAERVEQAFRTYFHRPKPEDEGKNSVDLIVGHANITRYLVCRALQIPPEAWLRMSISHCSITCVCIKADGSVKVQELGNIGHMPVHMITK